MLTMDTLVFDSWKPDQGCGSDQPTSALWGSPPALTPPGSPSPMAFFMPTSCLSCLSVQWLPTGQLGSLQIWALSVSCQHTVSPNALRTSLPVWRFSAWGCTLALLCSVLSASLGFQCQAGRVWTFSRQPLKCKWTCTTVSQTERHSHTNVQC